MLNANYKHKRLLRLCFRQETQKKKKTPALIRTIRGRAVNNDRNYFAIITQFDFENEGLILQCN